MVALVAVRTDDRDDRDKSLPDRGLHERILPLRLLEAG
jgi:hypothetical protein